MTDRFTFFIVAAVTFAAVVAILNLLTLKRLWASTSLERSQKVAQSVLLWLLPGSVWLVRYLLSDKRQERSDDPTTGATSDTSAESIFVDHGGHHNV
jgi:hypothetical protein